MKKQMSDLSISAVIYARYSSHGQREESIEGQLRDCHEFARRNNMTVVGEYVDKALSGKTDKRPDFQRMLRDSERSMFQAVICWKMDRFARNRYDSAIHKYKLKKNGVRIFYAKESIPESPEGIILESVMEGYAEYYSENLSQNVKREFYDRALELKTLPVNLPKIFIPASTMKGIKRLPADYLIRTASAVFFKMKNILECMNIKIFG